MNNKKLDIWPGDIVTVRINDSILSGRAMKPSPFHGFDWLLCDSNGTPMPVHVNEIVSVNKGNHAH